jgi:hypothetical protein
VFYELSGAIQGTAGQSVYAPLAKTTIVSSPSPELVAYHDTLTFPLGNIVNYNFEISNSLYLQTGTEVIFNPSATLEFASAFASLNTLNCGFT